MALASVTIRHVPLKDLQGRIKTVVREDPELDEVWYVLDEDERLAIARFTEWLSTKSGKHSGGPQIHPAISIPRFEYWFLLHFRLTTRAFQASSGGDSACKQVVRELRKHLPRYDKGNPKTWQPCHERRREAIENAKSASQARAGSSTDVWRLVERLTPMSTADGPSPAGPASGS